MDFFLKLNFITNSKISINFDEINNEIDGTCSLQCVFLEIVNFRSIRFRINKNSQVKIFEEVKS